ncbi:MAG: hypothetical protein O8C64_06605 [Candidatus Methanoperedens sp.]|nr:hypothetical protein [Candidatus Methanoperedens sp.]
MRYKTIKNCGEIGIEFEKEDNDGTRVSKDFLEQLINRIVKRSTNYYDKTGEHIFVYREKQLHSVICPSIADLTNNGQTDSYVMEHPLIRKPHGEDEYSGHIDYWISYRKYSFVMELKHSYFSYEKANNPRQDISKKLNKALDQLKSVRKNECRDLSNNKGLIKIALQAIVFYHSSQEDIVEDEVNELDFKKTFKQLIINSDLNNKSNFRSLWLLNQRLIESVSYSNNLFEIYPAVAFVGYVSNVIPPKQ